MRTSGQIQRTIWEVRSRLRKSELLRHIVGLVRGLGPDSRDRHLGTEARFWRNWIASEGLIWPEEFGPRFDPDTPVQPYLARIVDQIPSASVEILDVGAGPVTIIGKRHASKLISITATDPLASQYAAALAEFGLTPPVRTIYAEAEKLRQQLRDRRFDIVHARNSLDHSADPFAGLEEMLALTRESGFVVLLHDENEGSNEHYHALHKWDFTCEDGHFVIAGPGPDGTRRDVSAMLADRADVQCSVEGGEVLVTIRKREAAGEVPT